VQIGQDGLACKLLFPRLLDFWQNGEGRLNREIVRHGTTESRIDLGRNWRALLITAPVIPTGLFWCRFLSGILAEAAGLILCDGGSLAAPIGSRFQSFLSVLSHSVTKEAAHAGIFVQILENFYFSEWTFFDF
jgi:hypothetical protein